VGRGEGERVPQVVRRAERGDHAGDLVPRDDREPGERVQRRLDGAEFGNTHRISPLRQFAHDVFLAHLSVPAIGAGVQDLFAVDRCPQDMDLDRRKLRYFAEVAEQLHFGAAAERLHITQPVLSRQISQLERELGVTRFTRSSQRVALTPAGRQLQEEARALLPAADAARNRVRDAERGERAFCAGFVDVGYGRLPITERGLRLRRL
jgi:DNA-binding HxlR family transcriptional regulator